MEEELIIILKGVSILLKQADSENDLEVIPFIGFRGGYAGVGFLDIDGEYHIFSNNERFSGNTPMPIIKAWRAFKIISMLNKRTSWNLPELAWKSYLDSLEKAYSGDIGNLRAITESFPSDSLLLSLITETLLAGKRVDFEEIIEESAKGSIEVPRIIQAFKALLKVIDTQDAVLRLISYDVLKQVNDTNNPYKKS